jgi:transcriptional regulator with XRE-family HTH domain
MGSEKLLGEFLRARREGITPEQVGLLYAGLRRTPGLRREEVAMLADVSTDYYIRLEQGRERRPSERVLDALARVLDLGPDAATHLYELAHPGLRQRGTPSQGEQVSPNLLQLMRNWPNTPAMVFDRWLDVLARNPLATALFGGLEYADNLIRLTFLDPAAPEFFLDWEKSARAKVAHLRAAAGADLEDPYLTELVDELSFESPDFRQMWARHDVSGRSRDSRRFHHREVGDLALVCEVFSINSAPGQQLIIYQAEPGSPSEQALTLLGSLATMTP